MASMARPNEEVSWGASRPALVCMLCTRKVGEVVLGRIVHHGGCSSSLTRVGRTIRCCNCRGPVTVEED